MNTSQLLHLTETNNVSNIKRTIFTNNHEIGYYFSANRHKYFVDGLMATQETFDAYYNKIDTDNLKETNEVTFNTPKGIIKLYYYLNTLEKITGSTINADGVQIIETKSNFELKENK